MPKVTIVQVIYNNRKFIEPVFSAIFRQTYKDFRVVAVISGNNDNSKELLQKKFPEVEIIDPGYNIGFAKGHNLVFEKYKSDFFQLVNPDLIMEPDYLEKILLAFGDPNVGAATGKLYQVPESGIMNFEMWKSEQNKNIIDTTGVTIYKSGKARDRGQHEVDFKQYDRFNIVDAVSGAGCMYRLTALEEVKEKKMNENSVNRGYEYFDEDFHSYWEDVDLAWRMKNFGWKNLFVPDAIAYHGRGAGSNKGGYWNLFSYIRHHKSLDTRVKKLNYKNHIFMYIKNSPWFYPQFFIREFFMLIYIVLFEKKTLSVLPEIFRNLPKIWQKRIAIKNRPQN